MWLNISEKENITILHQTIFIVAIGKDVLIVVGTEISDKVKINENTKPEYIFEITSEDN